jgi:hypothetical protein
MAVTEITNETHGCRKTQGCYVIVPAYLSHTGKNCLMFKKVDACLAPLVDALNSVGKNTASCCCGHGKAPGVIVFHDKTELQLPVCKKEAPDG